MLVFWITLVLKNLNSSVSNLSIIQFNLFDFSSVVPLWFPEYNWSSILSHFDISLSCNHRWHYMCHSRQSRLSWYVVKCMFYWMLLLDSVRSSKALIHLVQLWLRGLHFQTEPHQPHDCLPRHLSLSNDCLNQSDWLVHHLNLHQYVQTLLCIHCLFI